MTSKYGNEEENESGKTNYEPESTKFKGNGITFTNNLQSKIQINKKNYNS